MYTGDWMDGSMVDGGIAMLMNAQRNCVHPRKVSNI